MRIIDLDFYADKGGSIFLGYAGEHLSTVLNFHMPAEFSKDNCLYLVNFETDDGQVLGGSTPQEPQTVGKPTADSLIAFRADRDSNIVKYYVPNTVIGATAHTGKFQLSVYGLDVTNNNYKLLGYSTQFSYVIDNAINIGTSISFSNDFIAALDDLLSAIEGIGNFSELSEEYTDLVNRISEVLSNIEDNYGVISNMSDVEVDYNSLSIDNLDDSDKNKYLNLYRIKELIAKIKAKIATNTTNINTISTKVGSGSFDDSTKINNVIPSNIMDALKKISTALVSLDNDKINKANAIKYTSTSILNDCVEPGTIYRYTETISGNVNGLEAGDYTIIPSYIVGTSNLTQYIFSTKGEIYCRNRVLENGSYTYTLTKILSQKNIAIAFNDTTLSNTNRNKMLPTTGAVDDYIKELSEQGNIGGKDFIMNYNIGVQNWTYISQNNLHYYTINTSIFDNKYTITENTKIDIEPSIELITKLEEGFCMGIYIENNMPTDIRLYVKGYEHANPSNINNINIVLKLSEVRYNNN